LENPKVTEIYKKTDPVNLTGGGTGPNVTFALSRD
jgi:hypothetical protein